MLALLTMDVSKLNEKQRCIFKQFAEAVADCERPDWADDNYLLKWLLARNFDVEKAETMLRKSMEWRLFNRIDHILDDWQPPEVLTKYYAMGCTGNDKFGCPVWISAYGRTDVNGILQSVTKRDYIRFITYITEQSLRMMRENAENSGQPLFLYQTLIMDMEELSYRQVSNKTFMDVGMETTRLTEANYPETVRRVFLINVPAAFTFIFTMVRPFLSQETLNKIRLFGSNREEWTAALLEEIDADQLPVHYGGNLADPDGNPMYTTRVSMGGMVPSSYFVTKPEPKPTWEPAVVGAGSRRLIHLYVEETSSTLRWEFITEEGDIGFKVYYLDKANEEVNVIPMERVDSHLMVQECEIACIRPATYGIVFDNTYSFLRSKKLWYRIEVIPPKNPAKALYK